MVLMAGEGAVGFGAFAFGDFQPVAQIYGGDAKEFVIALDAAFDVGYQVVSCRDSARFQRAGKCAGQSTSERRDDVIDGGRQRLGGFHAIILCVAAMHAEVQGFFESLDVRIAEWALLLHQPNLCGMNEFAHDFLLGLEMHGLVKSYSRGAGFLLVVLN
jgi:hypothetical protein